MIEKLKKVLHEQGSVEAVIVTDSMDPLIRAGDRVTIWPIEDFENLRLFDTIVYWDGQKLVGHYVVSHSAFLLNGEKTVMTKGLRNPYIDLPVRRTDVIGKIKKQWPWFLRLKQLFWILRK